ncbi:rhomboid-related protein 4-like [Ischnura elegans]|uniref:rhomboid-related protein 4-like n=1 Tax=Ischnura elegans TaxID=197161 RepID=UPI001ED878AA|nr:rhomboid-related protein 4-like [Ischnura elegans]
MSGRRRGAELGVLLLLYEMSNIGFRHIPPVTLFAVAGQALLYSGFIPVKWDRWDVCLSTEAIIYQKDYFRLLISALEHGSDMHLYYNMISFIFKGRELERYMFGSVNFALFLLMTTLMCSSTYVGLNYILLQIFQDISYLKTCAVGFSGVIFALKTLTAKREASISPGRSLQYSVWAELVLIHLLVPGSSFVGHLAGILVGKAYIHTPLGSIIDGILVLLSGEPVYRWGFLMGQT